MSAVSIIDHKDASDEELYFDILGRIKNVAVLSSEEEYHLCVVYIFFTYLSEAVNYFPYLWFYAVPERGKSRMLKAIIILSYRGLYTETLNEAYIFRYADLFVGTIGIDVYDLCKKAQNHGSHDLLLGRYEKGIKIARVVAPDKGDFRDTKYFNISGPTLLATNTIIPPKDPLRSRCIKISMPEARDIYKNNNSYDDLVDLIRRLYAFRFRHLGKALPDIAKPTAGRLGDIVQPLLCVAALLPDVASESLLNLIEAFEQDRLEAEAESLAGRIAQAIFDLKGNVSNGRLSVKEIRESVNKDVDEKYQIAPQTIGREITAMDIEKTNAGGQIYIVWDDKNLTNIFSRYLRISSSSSYSPSENMMKKMNMMKSDNGAELLENDKTSSTSSEADPNLLKRLKITEQKYLDFVK